MGRTTFAITLVIAALGCAGPSGTGTDAAKIESRQESPTRRLLYVGVPGLPVREPGAILIYDIDAGHALVRRIPFPDVEPAEPIGFKGIEAHAGNGLLYLMYGSKVAAIDLESDALKWTVDVGSGADRGSITPDGRKLYVPTGYWRVEPYWNVIDGRTGEILKRIEYTPRGHNTLTSNDGKEVYFTSMCGDWWAEEKVEACQGTYLAVVDASTDEILRRVGPFSDVIRPFTVDGKRERVYVNVNDLLGFEVGDLETGRKLARVEVDGFSGAACCSWSRPKVNVVKHHGCQSHGVGLTRDGEEVWVVDAPNSHLHAFTTSVEPPKLVASIPVSDQPNWITFGIDGRYAYPSTGDIIETSTRKIVGRLVDEKGDPIQSEKMIEIHFEAGRVSEVGNQFGVPRD